MSNNSAIIKLIPQVDKKKMKEGLATMNRLQKTYNTGKNIASMGAKTVGAFSLLSIVLAKNDEYLKSMDDTLNDIVKKADTLSTISADLGSLSPNSGSFALTSATLSSKGIDEVARDKMIASIQDNLGTGKLEMETSKTLDDLLGSLQQQWQTAKKGGDFASQKRIEDILGLRGKQASEFLQGNLADNKKEMSKLIGISEEQLTQAIENNATLENEQAKSLAVEDLKMQALLNEKVGGKGDSVIKSQVELEAYRKRMTLEMMGSYDKLAEAEKVRLKFFKAFTELANGFLTSAIDKSGKFKPDVLIAFVVKTLKVILYSLADVFVELGRMVRNGVTDGAGKLVAKAMNTPISNKTMQDKAKEVRKTNPDTKEANFKELYDKLKNTWK